VPGVDDPERVKDLLGRTARLTFHLLDPSTTAAQARRGGVPAGSVLLSGNEVGPDGEPLEEYVVRRRVMVSGDTLTDAQPTFQEGRPVVSFSFDQAGARRFGDVTSENVGQRLAIVLDGEVISAPVIRSPILGGNGVIEGGFTTQTANDLALLLRAGALPAPLTVLEERTVGPGLGADSIAAGKAAAAIGFVLVVVFMIVSYGLFGLFAAVALVFNLALILAVLSMIQATLTLPGIAGIVLTVGMAVDANVLIFERIREEIANGRSPISSVDAGYGRALTTIIDANLTTLIAALLLFAFGSGPIKGFAVTLSVGIVASMFTAIMVTRLMVVVWLRRTRPKAIPI
jgi:preprotein translocase subunit SecD